MSSTRTFEFKDDKSSKFWEITQNGNSLTVRYGKSGTRGQCQEKTFQDETEAKTKEGKLIAEKLGKGYLEIGAGDVLKKSILIDQENYLNHIFTNKESPSVRKALEKYLKNSVPYALPKFQKQDWSSPDQRKTDMIGGYPYTSEFHPWPTWKEDGLPMQPIAQIDLDRAGDLLGVDFGSGIAQIWTRIALSEEELDAIGLAYMGQFDQGIMLRVIRKSDLLNEPVNDFPKFAPWTNEGVDEINRNNHCLLFHPLTEMKVTPIVQWMKAGQMFDYVDLNTPMEAYFDGDEYWDESEDPTDLFLRFREIANTKLPGPMTNGSLFLGGVGGASGADDPAFRQRLVFNIMDSRGMNIALIFDESEWITPSRETSGNNHFIRFHREKRLRAVFSLPSKSW